MRTSFLLLALCAAFALPVHAQLTPEQKQVAQKVVAKDLGRMADTGQETGRLNAMINNGTPKQQSDYHKLKERNRQQATNAGTPWTSTTSTRGFPENHTSEEVPHANWHTPGTAESPAMSSYASHAVKRGMEVNSADCASRSHPERDAACQALGTQSGF